LLSLQTRDLVQVKKKIAIVTCHWGHDNDDRTSAIRLIAGAASRDFTIAIVHLKENVTDYKIYQDSIYQIHEIPVIDRYPLRSDLIKVALSSYDNGQRIPKVAAEAIRTYQGQTLFMGDALAKIAPDIIILGGLEQPYNLSELDLYTQSGDTSNPNVQIITIPFLNQLKTELSEEQLALLNLSEKIVTTSPGEKKLFSSIFPNKVTSIHMVFNINRHAAKNMLFGVRYFDKYVLLLRSFPPETQRFERSLTHEVLRTAIAPLSVAEVDNEYWRISDDQNTLKLPVSASRVNLWRLMAHAELTIDLRPPRPLGREAIESMLLGTPVIAHQDSIAYEHIKAANGGLWYENYEELIRVIRAALDEDLHSQLKKSALEYANYHHGDSEKFIKAVNALLVQ